MNIWYMFNLFCKKNKRSFFKFYSNGSQAFDTSVSSSGD